MHVSLRIKDLLKQSLHPSSKLILSGLISDHVVLHFEDITSNHRITNEPEWKALKSSEKELWKVRLERFCERRNKHAFHQALPRPLIIDIKLRSKAVSIGRLSSSSSVSLDRPLDEIMLDDDYAIEDCYQYYKVETVHPDAIASSSALALREQVAPGGTVFVPAGSVRSKVWEILFKGYVDYSSTITLYDRYAISSHRLQSCGTLQFDRSMKGMSYLLSKLPDSNVRTWKLHAQLPYFKNSVDVDNEALQKSIDFLTKQSECVGVKGMLYLYNKSICAEYLHDRLLVFDEFAWSLGKGISILSENMVPENYQLQRIRDLSVVIRNLQRQLSVKKMVADMIAIG